MAEIIATGEPIPHKKAKAAYAPHVRSNNNFAPIAVAAILRCRGPVVSPGLNVKPEIGQLAGQPYLCRLVVVIALISAAICQVRQKPQIIYTAVIATTVLLRACHVRGTGDADVDISAAELAM